MKRHTKEMIRVTFMLMFACLAADAQRPSDIVKWSANLTGTKSKTISARLTATIQDGWHIYAISQSAGGPTPLKISLPANSGFALERPVSDTDVVRHFDQNFNMETVYYLKTASFTVPLKGTETSASEAVPIDVRFQACSERLCLPPYTAHLSAAFKGGN